MPKIVILEILSTQRIFCGVAYAMIVKCVALSWTKYVDQSRMVDGHQESQIIIGLIKLYLVDYNWFEYTLYSLIFTLKKTL